MDKTSARGGRSTWKRGRHLEALNVQTGASGKNKTKNILYINDMSLKVTIYEHSQVDNKC